VIRSFAKVTQAAWDALDDATATEWRLYVFLVLHADRKTDELFWSQQRLTKELGTSIRSLRRAEQQLVARGLISISRKDRRRALVVTQPVNNDRNTEPNRSKMTAPVKNGRPKMTAPVNSVHETGQSCPPTSLYEPELLTRDLSLFACARTCELFNDLVASRTPLPEVTEKSVNILTRDLIEHHWRRYEENEAVFRAAFERFVETPGLWTKAGVTFTKLWQNRAKSGCSWFDALHQGEFATEWWTGKHPTEAAFDDHETELLARFDTEEVW